MRIAIVHDWLTGMRGGEKVLLELCRMFPEAELFTLVLNRRRIHPEILRHPIHTSALQALPAAGRWYRWALPWMPRLVERWILDGFDLVISSSHCVAKGVRVPAGIPHICYCHTPMRYVWDQYDRYFGDGRANPIVRWLMKHLRPRLQAWDRTTASRVTCFVANSQHVRHRIQTFYGREAEVVHPPVDTDFFTPAPGPRNRGGDREPHYYLSVGSLFPYKRAEELVEAANGAGFELRIVGDGPERKRISAMAGHTVKLLGWISDEELRRQYRGCRALLHPAEEDFGIAPVEAMACGRPVIGLARGGCAETIQEGRTGILLSEPTAEALTKAVRRLEGIRWDPERIRRHAEKFSRAAFQENLRRILEPFLHG